MSQGGSSGSSIHDIRSTPLTSCIQQLGVIEEQRVAAEEQRLAAEAARLATEEKRLAKELAKEVAKEQVRSALLPFGYQISHTAGEGHEDDQNR